MARGMCDDVMTGEGWRGICNVMIGQGWRYM